MEFERLILRRWVLDDVESLVSGLNNMNVARNFGTGYPYTSEDAKQYIKDAIFNKKEKFAIIKKDNNALIGGCGIHKKNGIVSTSLWIREDCQGLGYGTEAYRILVKYCFNTNDIMEITNNFFPDNIATKKMQEKVGAYFPLEGSEYNEANIKPSIRKKRRGILTRQNFYKRLK